MDSDYSKQGSPSSGVVKVQEGFAATVTIPDHELIRCIGQGSYGAVWLARNMMGMYRAVKIVYRKSFKDARPFEREVSGIRKFEPISRSHEGFIDVLHVGINDAEGYFYYVMELGDDERSGQTIDPMVYSPNTLAREIAGKRKLPVQDCLKLGLALSHALAELHRHGLVHRDIKPSNIIFVNGLPKLADIGLVADANEARSYVGTEGFIPPEGPGTAQADVYSLGKVLYEASTGRDRQDFPELPTNWDDPAEHDRLVELNEVILQACKVDLAGRYQSARDMHADLLVLEDGKSVRRLRVLEQRLANLKRFASLTALVLVVAGALVYHFYRERRFEIETRQRQSGADLANGARAVDSADYFAALPYFADTLGLDQGEPVRMSDDRLRIGSLLAQSPRLVQMLFGEGDIDKIELTRSGDKLLLAQHSGKVGIFDPVTSQPVGPTFGHEKVLRDARFSPDGTLVATASFDFTARIWRVSDRTEIARLPHPSAVLSAGFSPDGSKLVTGCYDNVARVWDWRSGTNLSEFPLHRDWVLFVTFSPNGSRVVSGSTDGTAWIWNPLNGEKIMGPLRHKDWVKHAAFSPDGTTLVTACHDNGAHIWDLTGSAPRELRPALMHEDRVFSAEFSPDGRWIVTAGLDSTVRLWDVETHQLVTPNGVLRHSDRVKYACFAPDGRRVLTACVDGTARIWDLAASATQPAPLHWLFSGDMSRFLATTNSRMELHDTMTGRAMADPFDTKHPGWKLELNQNGRFLICTSEPQTNSPQQMIEVWDPIAGVPLGPAVSLTEKMGTWALNGDGKRLCVSSGAKAQLWDVASGQPVGPMLSHSNRIEGAFFSRNGLRLGLWGGHWLQVRDAAGREVFSPLGHPFDLCYAEFSPDNSMVVTCGKDNVFTRCPAHVWDTATGKLISKLPHRDGTISASFSPDSTRLITTSEDFTATIWDARSGRRLAPVLRHGDQVLSAVFSEDGRWVLTASADKTARIWVAESGEPLTPPLRHMRTLFKAAFLPGSRRLVTMNGRGGFYIWDLFPDEKSVGDINSLSHLLSGDTVTPPGQMPPLIAEPVSNVWSRLQAHYPAQFEVPDKQKAAWHDLAAQQCESREDWVPATFHLERLLELRPGDPDVTHRLITARNGQIARLKN
jgi:WD40 repeat protein